MECPEARPHSASFYAGPLIDTHFHIANLPDAAPGNDDYGPPHLRPPLMGVDVSIDEIVCAFDYEGTRAAYAFFPVFPGLVPQFLKVVDREEILANHSNVLYGVDELYGDVYLLRQGVTREEFLAHFSDYEPLARCVEPYYPRSPSHGNHRFHRKRRSWRGHAIDQRRA